MQNREMPTVSEFASSEALGVIAVVTSPIEYYRIDGKVIVLAPGVQILVDPVNGLGQLGEDAFEVCRDEYSLLA